MKTCTQCSTRRQECVGGQARNIEDPAAHYPRLERRQAFIAKLDKRNWDKYLRPNGE